MNLDVFKADAFKFHTLTKAISDIPFLPTKIGDLGIFQQEPISTTSIDIERDSETGALVPAKPRGAPGTPVVPNRRTMLTLKSVHLPATLSVMADEVQNLRAFGGDSEEQTLQAWLLRKMAIARRRIDVTLEYHRIGALKGIVLDADGTSLLLNLFTEFGATQQTLDFELDDSTTLVTQKFITLKRMVEDALGGLSYTGIRVLASAEFFDALVNHAAVVDAFNDYQSRAVQRSDRRDGFVMASNVTIEEYRGSVGGTRFIAAGEAHIIVEGVTDLYVQNYSPAPYNDTVNTMGMPVYARLEEMPKKTGYEADMQSNPLTYCTRPGLLIKLLRY